jgi:hypothetical protein
MNRCVSEETLFALATGDGSAAERAHVRDCPRCAARAAALGDDLRLLRQALLEEPLPVTARAPRRHGSWLPIAGALAAAALLALAWAAPWRAPPAARPVQVAQVSSLARDVSAALFEPSHAATVAQVSDSAYIEAALNGGWPCGGLGLYGVDCRGADTFALYDE